jgi:hypothetical protein
MWAEKRLHEFLGGVLGVLGLAPSTHIFQIKQKVLKGYMDYRPSEYRLCTTEPEYLNDTTNARY